MSDSKTISLNGQRYDALTGNPVKDEAGKPASKKPKSKTSGTVRSIDGFIHARIVQKVARPLSPKKTLPTHSAHKIAANINRPTEHSKTLMRNAVHKPIMARVKHQQLVAKRHVNHTISKTIDRTAPVKEAISQRAETIKKSEFVGKFNELATPLKPVTPDPNTIQTTANSEVHLKNIDQLSKIEADPEAADDIFTQAALKISDSHMSSKLKPKRFYDRLADKLNVSVRALIIVAGFLFVVIAVGLITYLFMPDLSMYLASQRTGFHGVLPAYDPPGFSLKSINYVASSGSTGTITLHYKSRSDSRNYRINEQATTWDNQALVESVVEPYVSNNYKTFLDGGRSVYNFDDTSVWVGSDVYFNLLNNANLTSNQINQIVSGT